MSLLHGMLGNASEVDSKKVSEELGHVLIAGEKVDKAYLIIRDMMVFTPKRLILVDKQGVTGKKVEYFSIPRDSIIAFATETAGSLDLDAELKIVVKGSHLPITKKFKKGSNIDAVQKALAEYVLKN